MKAVRISAGAGYAGDRIEPALENIRRGNVDYIMFECLAERTIALAQKDRAADPQKGYNRLLEYRMERVLPLLREHPVKIITNMGAANPVAAAEKVRKMAAQYDLTDLKIAAVIGDEVTERIPAYGDLAIMETGEPLHTLADISGMQGGHSGNTIHMDRGNAVKVTEEFLVGLPAGLASLADISAGTLINIIPAHAEAVVVCPPEHADTVRTALDARIALLKEVYRHTEPQLTITVSQRSAGDGMTVLTPACAEKLLRFVRLCYVGAWRMADDTYSRAECSANPAILRLEQTEAKFTLSARSNSEYLHDQIIAHQSELAALCGWKAELESRAGAWEYNAASQLLPQVIPIFREVTGREPEIAQIHAGVEGGVFDTKAREIGRRLDMVNLGVMNYDVHTPRERMEIDSVKPLYEMLRQILMTVE